MPENPWEYFPLDPRLGRIPYLDDRSLQYPIRAILDQMEARNPRSYTWRLERERMINQGNQPACVGFSICHEIMARPVADRAGPYLATLIYKEAQKRDQWSGEDYAGTSVIAGMQVARDLGFYDEFRWAFGVEDAILALGYTGPQIWGINWYGNMSNPDADNFMHPNGKYEGGHAICAVGVNVAEEYFLFANTWGLQFGDRGYAKLRFEHARTLLKEQGEVCIPVLRS